MPMLKAKTAEKKPDSSAESLPLLSAMPAVAAERAKLAQLEAQAATARARIEALQRPPVNGDGLDLVNRLLADPESANRAVADHAGEVAGANSAAVLIGQAIEAQRKAVAQAIAVGRREISRLALPRHQELVAELLQSLSNVLTARARLVDFVRVAGQRCEGAGLDLPTVDLPSRLALQIGHAAEVLQKFVSPR